MLKERTSKIIKYLINIEDGISLDTLAKEFHVSVRTIRNEISNANYFLAKNDLSYIKNIKNKGIVLELGSKKREALLINIERANQTFLPEERYFDLILDIAFNPSPTYLYEKGKQFQVSKSTLDDDMRKI